MKLAYSFLYGDKSNLIGKDVSSIMSEQHIEAIHKISEALLRALQQVHTITGQYMKIINDQKRQKEKQRPPKVYYDKEVLNEEFKTRPSPIDNNDRTKIPEAQINRLLYGPSIENINPKIVPKAVVQNNRQPNHNSIQKPDKNGKNQPKQIRHTSKKHPHPERPKMPVSAFLLFNKDYAGKVRKEYPHLNQLDLVTVTGNLWKQLSDEDKKPFDDQYRRQKLKYDALMLEFYRKFPAEKSKKQLKLQKSLGNN